MFDRYYKLKPESVHYTTTVTEKRAPTDESVRLLMEMEQKALDKLLMCVKLEANEFKARWYIMPDNVSWTSNVFCKFILNNKEYEFEFPLPSRYTTKDEIVECVRMKIIDKMSTIMTGDLFTKNINVIRDYYEF